MGLNS